MNKLNPFLYDVAFDIIKRYQHDLSRVALVFPNKRSSVYFKKYYGEIAQRNIWAPNSYTIESFAKKLTGISLADELTLLYYLFESFNEIQLLERASNSAENQNYKSQFTFERFYSLGDILLHDFSEIDSFLVDYKKIFAFLKDVKEIENTFDFLSDSDKAVLQQFWKSFSADDLSNEKQRFIELWRLLPFVYEKFNKRLLTEHIGYQGLVYRVLNERIEKNEINLNQFQTIIFIGFNALSTGIEKLFNFLQINNKALFYWDVDSYYLNDKNQEAGFFMRDYVQKFPNQLYNNKLLSNINQASKQIDLIGVPLDVGQAKAIPTLLRNYGLCDSTNTNPEKTAIILADEQLLFPVLHSIPQEISTINVTMGYPFKDTPLYSFFRKFLQLHRPQKFVNQHNKFFYKDVISLLQNTYVFSECPLEVKKIVDSINDNNYIYIEPEWFNNFNLQTVDNESITEILFTPVTLENGNEIFERLLEILPLFQSAFSAESIENEFIYFAFTKLKRLKDVLDSNMTNYNFVIAEKWLIDTLLMAKMPFDGEPLQGIQVIGIMETRNLDYDNVIMLGINEGILPKTNRPPTFLPESIRQVFGLPVIKYHDAIYAYLFYRLLQRSTNITILHNNISGYNSCGELSRFVQQLQFESKLKINHLHYKERLMPSTKSLITIEKDVEKMQVLKQYIVRQKFDKMLSASAINSWLDCSLQFYFRYIAEVSIPQKVEEEITPLVFGNLLHKAMEKLYGDYIIEKDSQLIDIEDFSTLYQRVEKYIEMAFKIILNHDLEKPFIFEGNQLIIKEVLKRYCNQILETDEKYAPFEIVNLENETNFKGIAEVEIEGKTQAIGLRGIIDRLDCKDNKFRVVDYKTGSVDKTFKELSKLFAIEDDGRNRAMFQILLYTMILLQDKKRSINDVFPVIYNIREMNDDDFDATLFHKVDKSNIPITPQYFKQLQPYFKEILSETLAELFNKEIPFSQTQNDKICQYCNYKAICGI